MFFISSVCAADNDTVELTENSNEIVSQSNDNLINQSNEIGTFTDLQTIINDSGENNTLFLDKDYSYNVGDDVISINKTLTIDGQNHTLDAKGSTSILNITGFNVILKNINFINSNAAFDGDINSAIVWNGDSGSVINSNFINNTCELGSGAILINGDDVNIINSTFIYNNCILGTGAVEISGDNVNIINSTFIENICEGGVGAIVVYGNNVHVISSIFKANVGDTAGAILTNDNGAYIINSSFVDNNGNDAGAINLNSWNSNIVDSYFENNTANYSGGAIHSDYICVINNSIFLNNYGYLGHFITVSAKSSINNNIFIIKRENNEEIVTYSPIMSLYDDPYDNMDNVTVEYYENNIKIFENKFAENVTFSNLNTKQHNISMNYIDYNGDNTTNYILISGDKIFTTLNASNITVNYDGNKIKYCVKLTDENNLPLSNKIIQIILNNQSYNITTNSEGMAILNIDLLPGEYDVFIKYSGDENYNESILENRIIVKSQAKLSGKNVVMDYLDGSKYSVFVIGDDGKIVVGGVVSIKINGKTFRVKTDSKGYASFKIMEIPKKYKITATYNGKSISNKITVKQILKSNNAKVKKSSKKLTLKATLKSSKGKAIKGKLITFKFNGKNYKVKTDKKGVASVKISKKIIKKLKIKKYAVSIAYQKDVIKAYVTVKK